MSTKTQGDLHPHLRPNSTLVTEPDSLPPAHSSDSTDELETTKPVRVDQPQIHRELRIYSHSSILYWWPVWVIGYIMDLDASVVRNQRLLGCTEF